VHNPELDGLEGKLQELVQQGHADGFLLYLLGLVLADRWGGIRGGAGLRVAPTRVALTEVLFRVAHLS